MRVLDSTILIDHLRGHAPALDLLETLVRSEEETAVSEMSRFEILAGARSGELNRCEALFSALTPVPVTEEISRAAAAFARHYRQGHSGIDAADYLIAATAVVLEADLLTTNVRHFPMFQGLSAPYG